MKFKVQSSKFKGSDRLQCLGGTGHGPVLGGNLPPSLEHSSRARNRASRPCSAGGLVARQNGPVARSTRSRHASWLLPLFLHFVLCPLSFAAPAPSAPNFLFVFVDDQGWSGTSVAMIPGKDFSRSATFKMPNLDRLATQGMTFSQAYAAHPKCECSRAALQMGRTTTSLNAVTRRADQWTAPPTDSLANTLKRANPNYRAAHFGNSMGS